MRIPCSPQITPYPWYQALCPWICSSRPNPDSVKDTGYQKIAVAVLRSEVTVLLVAFQFLNPSCPWELLEPWFPGLALLPTSDSGNQGSFLTRA